MFFKRLLIAVAAALVLLMGLRAVPGANATGVPKFVIGVSSAFLRSAPSLDAPKVFSVFRDQAFPIVGRQADDTWLLLEVGGTTGAAWVPAHYGRVQGNLAGVPLSTITSSQAAMPTVSSSSEVGSITVAPDESVPVQFTLRVKSTFGRSAPSRSATPVASLFQGQTFRVSARLPDDSWLRLDYAGVPVVWVLTAYGEVQGALAAVPSVAPPSTAAATATPAATPVPSANTDTIVRVGDRAREIYLRGLEAGNNPRVFTSIGDCNSVTPDFLGAFGQPGLYRLGGPYAYLQETVQHFSGSFSRRSVAAAAGLSAAALLDPTWADPSQCRPGETPLACEYRLSRPSIALVSVGTNSTWQRSEDYEASLRAIIDLSIQRGVVPILGTKADNLEGDDRLNHIVVKLATEYDLPLWDFARAARALPDHGLGADRYHLTWGPQIFEDPQQLRYGWQWRNLTALQALDTVWRAVR